MINYGFVKATKLGFSQAVEKITQELKNEGFGVLTKIDVKEKFKEKLGVDFQNYLILGACNPANAHKALEAEINIGLMLPCNVVVYEKENQTFIGVIKPTTAMGMIENNRLNSIAEHIEDKLQNVFEAIV
jgi:uncharacterized protein (DUF302 family)